MPDIWNLLSIAVKFLLYLGVLNAVGVVMVLLAFASMVQPVQRQIKRMAFAAALLAMVMAGLGFLLQGATLTGDISGLTDPEMLGLLWDTSVGDVLLLRVAGMGMIMGGVFAGGKGVYVALVGGIIGLWSFAQIGHIPDYGALWLQVLLLLHLFGIAFWIGILSPLRLLCKSSETHMQATQLGHQFGQIAAFVVPALIGIGVVMAWLLLGDFASLFATGYGAALLVKILLVVGLLALAAANKTRFIPAMRAGDLHAARHLRHAVGLEWLIVIAILFTTAILTSVLSLPH